MKGCEVEVEGRRGYSGSGSFSFIPPIDSDSFLYPFFLAFSPFSSLFLSLPLFLSRFSINRPRRRLPPRRRNNQKIPYIRRVVVGLSSGYVPLVTRYPKSTVTTHTRFGVYHKSSLSAVQAPRKSRRPLPQTTNQPSTSHFALV